MTVDAALKAAFQGQGEPEGLSQFIDRVLEDYRPEELSGVSPKAFAQRVAEFWRWGNDGPLRETRVRLLRFELWDLLEITEPDARFLVDSVMGELAEAGLHVQAMFHPIVKAGGGSRSMIQVWLEPVPIERREPLLESLRVSLADVARAVADFKPMRALLRSASEELAASEPSPGAWSEDLAFLRWLKDEHFVFLGARIYEYPLSPDGTYAAEEPRYSLESSLGVLKDPSRAVLRRSNEPAVLSAALRRRLEVGEPVVIAKSNLRSRVHRRSYMDYIGVRRFGAGARPTGEIRFVGLFTDEAYDEPVREIPLLRRKMATVMRQAGFPKGSHNAARLASIIESYPRDELFQVSEGELLKLAVDILHLQDRPKVKLFARPDPFDRFISVLLFVPRERYDSRLRALAGDLLARAYEGRVSAYYPSFSDAPLARVQFIIGVTPGGHAQPNLAALEARIALAARTWSDDLEAVLRDRAGSASAAMLATWGEAFPVGYRDRYHAEEAFADLSIIEGLGHEDDVAVRAFREPNDSPMQFRFKLYRCGAAPARLSRVSPILADMGLSALAEEGHPVTPKGSHGETRTVWVHEFLLDDEAGADLTFEDIKKPFETAFRAVWDGLLESDGFNRLILELGAEWREAALIRALARYRVQSGLDPTPAVQQEALANYPEVARLILRLFQVRFDPSTGQDMQARAAQAAEIEAEIEAGLQDVAALDDDRVLRRLAALVAAMTRTNYYQPGADGCPKPYISFKVASRELKDLPAPKPFREIFVSAPNVEGVHLRMGPVARGGLRWSDRRDDFRTEVLGLVKAQQVKNAVIVPVGSKGGFFPKRLPRGGAPEAVRAEAVDAYKTFLRGLLDLTDNYAPDGSVIHPPSLVIHDADDPYLVVAADKGTATFSDIANGIAEDFGFWLGDAFASGGSAGYDHKAMGITARGAWEGIKRHFREMGRDIQRQPTTVIGVGDMSGDVFGNGMLLSKALRLRAAFDHRHIFIDPDPDPAVSWAERKRLFDLPRSSWDDYDRKTISAGGGVWSRAMKSIPLSDQARELLDVKEAALSPAELIVAILKSRADLLYLGGIGTYVKGSEQSNLDVGDKANDAIRVNGRDLRSHVVGEGANLGFTQEGRIEFALNGGRIDTDAIDNSAGVDTSDHEVNIKILTGLAERGGRLDPADRDPLLFSMTDEIASHVLADNYDQTLILSLMQAEAPADAESQNEYMEDLERRGRLDRALEDLPDRLAITDRQAVGKGLTRPELSVLLAYGKLDLFDDIIASTVPDDPALLETLKGYFPRALGPYREDRERHPLRREIIATVVGNTIVNLCGPTFASRLRAAAACDTRALVAAFEASRRVLRFTEMWRAVERLDGQVPAQGQLALFAELAFVLRGQTFWLARRAMREDLGIVALASVYGPAVKTIEESSPAILSPFERRAAAARARGWVRLGAPKELAHRIALLRPLTLAATLTHLARDHRWPAANTAFVYHKVGGVFGFDRLRAAAGSQSGGDAYERLAMRRLIEDMLEEQAALTGKVMAAAGRFHQAHPERDAYAVNTWAAAHEAATRKTREELERIEKSPGGWTFAKLTIANSTLRELAGV